MRQQSNMTHRFADIPEANIPRSSFLQKSRYKTTFNADYLIPFYHQHVMPGDTFNWSANLYGRMNTPIYPLLDNLVLSTFYFFVPYRQLQTNFRKLMGERTDPGDSIAYTFATVTSPVGGFTTGTLADYLGLPVDATAFAGNTLTVMSLPFRGYNHIWKG